MTTEQAASDCVIIGAGAAGISAGHWLRYFGVPFSWFSSEGTVGGMLRRVNNPIENYPGGTFASGASLIGAFEDHLRDADGPGPQPAHVRTLVRDDERWQLTFLDHEPIIAKTVILATGTRYRTLGVPGEDEGLDACVSQSATGDGEDHAGKTVAVVGGGDAGFENALRLAEHDCTVWMLLRNDHFKARPSFVERVQAHPKIEFYPFPTRVTEIRPGEGELGCRLILDVAGRRQMLDVACLFVRIGVDPVVPHIAPSIETNDGYIVVDSHQRTSVEGLFAAGDVTDCLLRSVATSVGGGATAAKAVATRLGYL